MYAAGMGPQELAEVGRLIRLVNEEVVLPLHGHLSDADVTEKSPGEVVTLADSRAEEWLAKKLTALLPGSVLVGEESVGRDPTVLSQLESAGPIWIVDPIDGTENFIAGRRHFSTMVALAHRGELVAAWLHAPLLGLDARAVAGGGTFVNGMSAPRDTSASREQAPVVGLSNRRWWSPRTHEWDRALRRAGIQVESFDTAGLAYVGLLAGRQQALVLEWEHVWDHAAGVVLLREAGGVVIGSDGGDFRLSGANALPMVAATDGRTAQRVHQLLHSGMGPAPNR